MIAFDGAGGRFFLLGTEVPQRPVLYADSEGSAGLVGSNLADALSIMVALPNWRNLLGFSGGGDIDQMRRARAWLEEGLRRWHPDLSQVQPVLVSKLELMVPDDTVQALWESVRATDPSADFIDDDDGGLPWGSLFHEWTIERLMRQ